MYVSVMLVLRVVSLFKMIKGSVTFSKISAGLETRVVLNIFLKQVKRAGFESHSNCH
jgi:hypothetical protein